MTYYPTTLCFARNTPSQTLFECMECAKEQYGQKPHEKDGVMMVNYHTELEFIRCDNCGEIIRDN